MKKLFKKIFPSKELRAYRKMYRRHKRELAKLTQKVKEWDYGWLDELVRTQIKHMYEYFSEGNNVWQVEESRVIIVRQLKYVLDLYDEMDNLWESSTNDLSEICRKEQKLYEEIYKYIASNMRGWWD